MSDLKENQVKLSDGRVVELREAIGSDEMVVAGQLGDTFTADGAGSVIFMSCLIARTIDNIDGQKPANMRSYQSFRDFIGQFKARDWNKIRNLYNKMNVDVEGND